MKVYNVDIWKYLHYVDATCITTNGVIGKNGAIMGKGIALQAKKLFPDVSKKLAKHINDYGNIPGIIHKNPILISFPTKDHWKEKSYLELIENSSRLLSDIIKENNWKKVTITKPGCSNGGLLWPDVEIILEKYLPNILVCDIII
jgi:hypothetical protein